MTWRDQAHLFAINFDVLYGDQVCTFLGTDEQGWNARIVKRRGHDPFPNLKEESYVGLHLCKLIARPMEDITDEEKQIWNNKKREDVIFEEGKGWINTGSYFETPESFLYLLSIGVYPFSNDKYVTFKSKHKV